MEILKQIKILEKRLFDMRTVGVSKKHCQDVQNEIDRLKGKYQRNNRLFVRDGNIFISVECNS
jgi:uncharacterized coiled-coil DUF342 family protein